MRTPSRSIAVAVTAAALVTGGASVASAAPTHKGTTTIAASPLTAGVLVGLTGPAQQTAAGAVFGIVGNPSSGVIKHVGGLVVKELNPATPATTLSLSNFWVDTRTATVSAIVDDATRVTVFRVDLGTGVLTLTPAASTALIGAPGLAGQVAGTATIALR